MKLVHRIILTILFFALALGLYWIIKSAGQYYLLSILERPRHEIHKLWKPGGVYGHGLGIIGSTMMIVMFSYSLRKRVRVFRRWGNLSTWLKYHIFLGIAGPTFITFHTAFKFGGLVSVSFWSMIAVAFSGVIGRYLYNKLPRRVSGKELSLQEFEGQYGQLKQSLESEFDLSAEHLEIIRELGGREKIQKRGLLGIFTLFSLDILGWFTQRRQINALIKSTAIPQEKIKEFRSLLKQRLKVTRQYAFWKAAHQLFHYWHVIHKPFAYTMVVIMIIHVITAVTFGYTWVF